MLKGYLSLLLDDWGENLLNLISVSNALPFRISRSPRVKGILVCAAGAEWQPQALALNRLRTP